MLRENSRPLATLAMAFFMIFPLGGCGKSSPTAAHPTGTSSKPRIALIMKSLANEFFSDMAAGAQSYQREHSDQFDLIVNGTKDEHDLSRQVALVEEMVASQVDAIVIAPADSKVLIPVCKRALEAGLVVINIDNKFDDQVLAEAGIEIPFVGPDNLAGARMAGELLASKLTPDNKVAILEGIPSAYNAVQRKRGFEEAMKSHHIEIIDSQSGRWEMGIANTLASAMLSEHADLDAILCSNDSMALGALAAAREAGRLGSLKIIGFDNIRAIHQPIRDGHVLATVDQHAGQLATFGIEYALQILGGKAVTADKETPVDLVTAEELKDLP